MSEIGKIVRKNNAIFYWTCRYLFSKAKREAIYAIYAFCKHIDGIVDGQMSLEEKVSLMSAWKQELHNIYDNKVPETEVGRFIYKNCMRFKLPKDRFMKLLAEFAIDVPDPVQKLTLNDFNEYCKSIAGTPCYFAMKIIGIEDKVAEKLADHLGYFLQINDILLDVKEDAKMNRLYIPIDLMKNADIPVTDPEHTIADKNFSAVRKELGNIAEDNLIEAKNILNKLNKQEALPFKILLDIHEQCFYMMKNRGWEIISPKPTLSKAKKCAIIFKRILIS